MPTLLTQKREELVAKQKALAAIFEEAGPEIDLTKVKSLSGDTATKAAEIKRLHDELAALGAEVERLAAVEKAAQATKALGDFLATPSNAMTHPSGKSTVTAPAKSIGTLFVESKAFKEFSGGKSPVAEISDFDVKTLFQTTDGWPPETTRTGRVILAAERALVVADLPMLTETTQSAIVYMEETTKTNAAAETAEGGAYPEATLELSEKNSPVRKIAVYLPVTDEQFEDEPRARDYVDNRLRDMLNRRLDGQLLTGDGVAPNLTGVLNVAGIQTQAKGADPTFDAVHKAITKVRYTGFSEPDSVIFHPNDWQEIRLTRTADGIYILGNPSDPGPERIWGLPRVVTPAIPEGTGLVGAWREFAELSLRRGIEFDVSNSHADFFVNGKLAIRASFRAAFVVYRPAAFCTVTGI